MNHIALTLNQGFESTTGNLGNAVSGGGGVKNLKNANSRSSSMVLGFWAVKLPTYVVST